MEEKNNQQFWIKNIRAIVIFIFIAVFLWLASQNFSLSGKFETEYDFSKPSAFVSHLMPPIRTGQIQEYNGIYFQEILYDPVYFDVKVPYGDFKKAKLTLEYENEAQELVQAGIMANEQVWQFQIKPVENLALDNLINSNNWELINENGMILLQKEKEYSSIDEFINNLPDFNQIAVYNYKLDQEYIIEGYTPVVRYWEINKVLQGAHEFYTYIKDEELNFAFDFEDTNSDQQDDIIITLFKGTEKVNEVKITDDFSSGIKEAALLEKNLKEGAYKIEIKASENILIKQIRTRQRYLTFIDKINLAPGQNSTTVYTNGNRLSFQTTHIEGLQAITVDGQPTELKEVHEQYIKEYKDGIKQIYIPKNDIKVATDGLFVFDPIEYFNPEVTNYSSVIDMDKRGIQYIIAQYHSPLIEKGWKQGVAEFDLSWIKPVDRKYKFIISAPGLSQNNNILKLSNIKLEFSR